MKRWWVKLLLVLAAVLLLASAWLATSSVHSKSAVERYKDQLRAAGEKLDAKELIPPHIDPEKNGVEYFNQAFRLMPSLTGMLSSNPPTGVKMVAPGKAMVQWQQTEIVSDDKMPATNSWADLEQELQLRSSALEFIRQAVERPQLNFELDYQQGAYMLLPHLSKMKQAALLFSPAVVADLHRGDPASAVANLHTLLAVVDVWKDEPLLISQLVRIAMIQIAANAQWELLQGTNITDQQLASLQRDWTNAQFIEPIETALLMERVWGSMTITQLRSSNSPSGTYSSVWGSGSGSGNSDTWLDDLKNLGESVKRKASDSIWRASWSYDDELKVLQGDQVLVEAAREIQTNGYFKDALAARDRKLAALGLDRTNHNWLRNKMDDELALLGPDTVNSLRRSLDRVLICEAARNVVTAAIVLKRYQLRHGTLPQDLNALVPEFLPAVPRDPVDGKRLRYQLNSDGTFLLYSIGADGVDDGGDATPVPPAKALQWLRGRDWVWPQPATEQEIQNYYANLPK
jgi:hypothetical protein